MRGALPPGRRRSSLTKSVQWQIELGKSSLDNYNDTDDIIKASQKDLSNYYDKICHCMEELGLVFAIEVS
ncbi:Type III restriction enzyme, res subunit [Musa troglodytarum]|uniref:Type III restriction enzyme, res subunit n=1 Tax=Musa troglodytarum TaxID=320322 RepID=A0A9E7I332_9LILI|nr:Type III restriction enzyme, res subunit [Musa troglodytarum]